MSGAGPVTWLWPTRIGSRRRKARTTRRATRMLAAVGFQTIQWHRIDAVIIRAATAQVATGRK
jgi:hypothetical protein